MKKAAKKIISIALSLSIIMAVALTAIAGETPNPASDFVYEIDTYSQTVSIRSYIGYSKDIVIPNEISGYPVTNVDFGQITIGVRTIFIPRNVASFTINCFATTIEKIEVDEKNESMRIYDNSLYSKDMTQLFQVVSTREGDFAVKEGTVNISSMAFWSCKKLINIYIPSSVVEMGGLHPFNSCESLQNFYVSESNLVFSSLDGVLFDKNKTTLLLLPNARAGDYVIPETVNAVGGWFDGFWGCKLLTSITFGVNINEVSNLRGCTLLEKIIVLNSKADFYEIEDCTSLKTIVGIKGSTAEKFAKDFGYTFEEYISEIPGKKPVPPMNINKTNVTTDSADITWDAVPKTIGYNVYINGVLSNQIPVTDTKYSITGLLAATKYSITVKAINSAGESENGTVISITTAAVKFGKGDVSGDGFIDSSDAILILRSDAGLVDLTEQQKTVADVTGDGKVDSADAIKIARYDAELIENF